MKYSMWRRDSTFTTSSLTARSDLHQTSLPPLIRTKESSTTSRLTSTWFREQKMRRKWKAWLTAWPQKTPGVSLRTSKETARKDACSRLKTMFTSLLTAWKIRTRMLATPARLAFQTQPAKSLLPERGLIWICSSQFNLSKISSTKILEASSTNFRIPSPQT